MSRLRRFARFVSVIWLIAWFAVYFSDPFPRSEEFLFFGVIPLVLVWGVARGPTLMGPLFVLFSALVGLFGIWLLWPWWFRGPIGRALIIVMLFGALFGLGRAMFRRGL
jgi:hypothetical protein